MTDANHPIWPLLRFVVVGIVITIVLAVNATDFDESEARAITAFLAIYGVSEGAVKYLQKQKKTEGEE